MYRYKHNDIPDIPVLSCVDIYNIKIERRARARADTGAIGISAARGCDPADLGIAPDLMLQGDTKGKGGWNVSSAHAVHLRV